MSKGLFLTTTAVIASFFLASCRKTEAPGVNDAIGFAPYVSRDVTKAVVTDVTASNLTSFKVACYLTGTATSYFGSEQSASKNDAGYWEATEAYYWPTTDKLDFFAYSGSGSSAVSNTDGVAKVSYTVPDTAADDFIVASAVGQGKPSSSPYTQSLSFSHALSKVSRLTLAPVTGAASAYSNYRYVVTDVRITGAKNSADYTFNPASGSNWGTASGEQDYVFDDNSFNFFGDSPHTLEVGTESKVNDRLIVLPQTVTFCVTYSVEYLGDDGTTWHAIMASETKTADIEMEAGKAYDITLRLPVDGTPIVFSASVTEWDDPLEVEKDVKAPLGFSVSPSKVVVFTKGNLYWDGNNKAFHLESSQAAYPDTWKSQHVGHFYWTNITDYQSGDSDYMPYAVNYKYSSQSTSDKFWCGEDNKLTVDGQSGLYVLSSDEWTYLLDARGYANKYAKARLSDKIGLIIFPDGYNGGVTVTGVTGVATVNTQNVSFPTANVADWSTMEKAGCVFLPCPGERNNGTAFLLLGVDGYYWSSTPRTVNISYGLVIDSGSVGISNYERSRGRSIRLVYDAQ